MISEWKDEVSAATEAPLNAQKAQWPAIYKTGIEDRNSAWMPEIKNYLASAPVEFVIIEMAYLYGADGLLLQLENKGYTLRQLVN